MGFLNEHDMSVPDYAILGDIMHKTLIANLTMSYADRLVICSGLVCLNREQLLALMRGFES